MIRLWRDSHRTLVFNLRRNVSDRRQAVTALWMIGPSFAVPARRRRPRAQLETSIRSNEGPCTGSGGVDRPDRLDLLAVPWRRASGTVSNVYFASAVPRL